MIAIQLSATLLVVATWAAYFNSLDGAFVFDDLPCIVENPSIRQLWPLSVPLNPPRESGYTVSGRPLLNLTLAVNHAISGTHPWSYHVGNVLIHTGAVLVLFGLLRRVLTLGRLAAFAMPTAAVAAAGWALHPLQTESVAYVIQRAESLMGLFYLLTLYGFVRMAEPEGRKDWSSVSVMACLLGTATKEVIVTAPIMVLLFDRSLFSEGLVAALRKRPGYYVALFATWIPLGMFVLSTGGDRGGTVHWTGESFAK